MLKRLLLKLKMKKFNFELQNVLDFRKFEQTQAENELGKALAKEKEIQDQLDMLAQQKIQSQKSVQNAKDFSMIAQASSFSEFVRKQSEVLFERMAEAKLVSDQKREILKKAMQKVDALEKLKENQQEEYKAEEKRLTAKNLGQIISVKYAREGKKTSEEN